MKTKQEWVCEGCGLSGKVEYDPKDGAFAVIHAICDHHERLASMHAPLCHFDVFQTRVRNPKLMDEFEWNRLVVKIEKDTRRKTS